MAKRQFELTAEEIEAFRQREGETNDTYELRRLQAVRAYGSGIGIQQIVAVIDCHEDSVRHWARQYRADGLSGLESNWASQNAAKLSLAEKQDLAERLKSYHPDQVIPPEQRVEQGRFWTVSDLQIVLTEWYDVTYRSESSYRRLLHECGFSYQRTEQVYRSRPDEQARADFEAELEKK